ncbi:efflux RND transporter periplasmic adaptor subunit [Xanthobacteraceae bacterium Astr-EGSB]|uniref:efflux RND transporter periplasmic adaptor subunit n=1 Tax=Astrobacterium formosum TaxID=3069710 RepID=UPI0027B1EEAB|nr:efflux RND transporter periplasmic adaptor subunit [Xanthobacteraceae bacterium Astr-EGSB]
MTALAEPRRLGIASVSTLLLLHCAAYAQGSPAALTVVAAPVETTQVTGSIAATGNVVAWREIPVGTEAGGLAVTAIAVDEGDAVVKGQVLARLNDDRIKAEILKQQAAIAELEANLAGARSDAARARSVASGVISAQTIEQRETLVKTTEARLDAARAQLLEVEARHRQTVIVAPAAGLISSRAVTIGQVIQAGTEMFRLIQDGRIEVDARVPESDLHAVAIGRPAKIVGPTGGSEPGTVRNVSPIVDPKTRLGTVRIALSSESFLIPGMFARVEIATESRLSLTVPLRALVWRDAKAHVFRLQPDNLVALTQVGIGRNASGNIEVLYGLRAGDRIVTRGAGLLNDGDAVNVETASVKGAATP